MSSHPRRDRDWLSELRTRLAGGIGPSLAKGRPGDWPTSDQAALAGWPAATQFDILAQLRENSWDQLWRDNDRGASIGSQLAENLRSSRSRLIAVLLSPAVVLNGLTERSAGDPVRAWISLCWVAEAAWVVTRESLDGADFSPGDRDLLAPLAARLRFLALSEPMRWRAELDRAWWAALPDDREFDGSALVRRVAGDSPWHVLVGQCREARRAWLDCLDAYQSHPLVAHAAPAQVDDELASVVFRHPQRHGWPGLGGPVRARPASSRHRLDPITLSDRFLPEAAAPTAEDAAIVSDVTERHLLPRFDLRAVTALAIYHPASLGRAVRAGLGAAVVALALAAVTCAALLQLHSAARLAVGVYVLIAAGVMAFGSSWAAPWLLRLPAASAIGVFALVSLLPGGWLSTPPGGWAASALLAGASLGYLVVEARNHGVTPSRALLRSLGVGAVGAVHALLVAVLGLVVVAPAFIGNGPRLAALWRPPESYRHAGTVLLLATAWCLTVGVFSQILWDDRPITAPLAHLRWRSEEAGR